MSLWKKFKRGVDSYRYLTPGQPVGTPDGENLVYEVNQVYMDVGQGGTSILRGFGALPILLLTVFGGGAILSTLPDTFEIHQKWNSSLFDLTFDVALSVLGGLFSLFMGVAYFGVTFLAPTDAVVRLDRKRQIAWLWNGRGRAIKMDWTRAAPRIHTHIANQFGSTVSHAEYVELDEDEKVVKTGKREHVFQCGHTISDAGIGYPNMEFVRRFMAAPVHTSPPYVKQLLQHRPKWWAMLNILGVGDDWSDWYRDRDKPGMSPMPWISTIVYTLTFPLWFPLQFSNWLALRVAPIPKWPKELEAMHAADLAELIANDTTSSSPKRERIQRKPVVRVNGQIVDS